MVTAACPPATTPIYGIPKYYYLEKGVCNVQPSFFGGTPILSQGVGYAVVVGFGAVFAVLTSFLIWVEKRYYGVKHDSEWFNTAGRNVKTGLIASVIVSQWTWAATILQSSNVAYNYGVSGPFWYASGATIQILLFGIMAIEIKRKAPTAHTICEIVKARWGTAAHLTFLFWCLMTNVIVTGMLILGGSAVVKALTGMNIYVASFLIPAGVVVYTLHGGLKATFLAAYLHSVVIHVVLVIFVFLVYAGKDKYLGTPKKVFDLLTFKSSKDRDCSFPLVKKGQPCGPVKENRDGSYLTMLSLEGLIFGIINIIGNFGTVFVDNGYWISAIAARPSSSHKGYLLGGMVWFAIPFSLATSLGLGALALNIPVTYAEAGAGLVPPATAVALMGKSGAILLLTMLFMAVTSAGSSELIAVSSLLTYDVYRTYFNPKATGKQILFVSRICVFIFGIIMGCLAILLNWAGVSLGWMYVAMGCFIGAAVVPVALLLLWDKANASGAIMACFIGTGGAIITWCVVAQKIYGRVTLETTGKNGPVLAGNLVAILLGAAVHIIWSLIFPEHFDWEATRKIPLVEGDSVEFPEEEYNDEHLEHARRWILWWGCGFTVLIVIIWPLLSLPVGKFNGAYFFFWAIISILWGTVASAIIIIMPLYENAEVLWTCFKNFVTCNPVKDEPVTEGAKAIVV